MSHQHVFFVEKKKKKKRKKENAHQGLAEKKSRKKT